MALLEVGKVTPQVKRYQALSCARLYIESDSAGVAIKRFEGGMIDGELRFITIAHEDDGSAATLSIYLEDDFGNSLLGGEAATGLAAGSGGVAAKYKKLQFEDIGSVQARALLVAGPALFRFVRSSAVLTRLVVEFWSIPAAVRV